MLPETTTNRHFFFSSLKTLTILVFSSLAACAQWLPDAHRLDLQQGNTIEQAQRDQIHIGMSKHEIRQILGEPMLTDPFHRQRWDYIYRFIPGRGEEKKSRLTLFFVDDRLQAIDDSEFIEP